MIVGNQPRFVTAAPFEFDHSRYRTQRDLRHVVCESKPQSFRIVRHTRKSPFIAWRWTYRIFPAWPMIPWD